MPRPRKPSALLALSGTAAHDPGRYADRANEPASNGPIGAAPDTFSQDRKAIWNEIVGLVPPGVLTKADRIIVEITTDLIYKLRTGEILPAELGHLRASLGSLGCTPADRSRVTAAKEATTDAWSELAIN